MGFTVPDSKSTTNILIGNATLVVGTSDVGYTKGGVNLEHSGQFYEVEVDQETAPVKTNLVREDFIIRTNLSENSLTNIKMAWGIVDANLLHGSDLGDGTDVKALRFGGFATNYSPPERVISFYGVAPGTSKNRKWHFYRCIAVDFGTIVHAKGEESVIPVAFRAMPDTNYAVGKRVGYVSDET